MAPPAIPALPIPSPPSSSTTSKDTTPWDFITSYYRSMSQSIDSAEKFYLKNAVIYRGQEGQEKYRASGFNNAKEIFKRINLVNPKYMVTDISSERNSDRQYTIQVIGRVSTDSTPASIKFTQFFIVHVDESVQCKIQYDCSITLNYDDYEEEEEDVDDDEVVIDNKDIHNGNGTNGMIVSATNGVHDSRPDTPISPPAMPLPQFNQENNYTNNHFNSHSPQPNQLNQLNGNSIHTQNTSQTPYSSKNSNNSNNRKLQPALPENEASSINGTSSLIASAADARKERPIMQNGTDNNTIDSNSLQTAQLSSDQSESKEEVEHGEEQPNISSVSEEPLDITSTKFESHNQEKSPDATKQSAAPQASKFSWASIAQTNVNKGSTIRPSPLSEDQLSQPSRSRGNSVSSSVTASKKPDQQQQRGTNNRERSEEVKAWLFVKNISSDVNVAKIKDACSRFGRVEFVDLVRTQHGAYVEYASASGLEAALKSGHIKIGQLTLEVERRKHTRKPDNKGISRSDTNRGSRRRSDRGRSEK